MPITYMDGQLGSSKEGDGKDSAMGRAEGIQTRVTTATLTISPQQGSAAGVALGWHRDGTPMTRLILRISLQ